ncbi:electron transfer flavoprotein subunit alpha/FixB family protein [Albidovulum sp.]|uniref:electron transfer flavoprotein subunit alpha/FixB family protein n=1 Tax=Albidovulum sp. TaxID=1872424 RepID=UPI0039B84966
MTAKAALFVLIRTPDTTEAEVATLAALALTAKGAGLTLRLLVVEAGGGPLALPPVFASVEALSFPAGCGDGAMVLDGMIAPHLSDPALIVTASTLASRLWAARLAARMKAEFLPACEKFEAVSGSLTLTTPVMGGMVKKSVTLADTAVVALYAGEDLAAEAGAEMNLSPVAVQAKGPRLVKSEPLPDTGGIPLRGAARVVSGGLGIGSAEAWPVLEAFAARIGAAVGASRAAVEMGWVPSSRQVGFSGQKVAPEVYVAVGISGAVHHLAGITGARKIVAVNKDPEANILKVADLAIVGDWKEILAAAMRRLDA